MLTDAAQSCGAEMLSIAPLGRSCGSPLAAWGVDTTSTGACCKTNAECNFFLFAFFFL